MPGGVDSPAHLAAYLVEVEQDRFHATAGIGSSAHRGVLYRRGSDLSRMRQGELCRDRCMDLLLAECMQDIGAARLDVKTRCTGLGLKSGVW